MSIVRKKTLSFSPVDGTSSLVMCDDCGTTVRKQWRHTHKCPTDIAVRTMIRQAQHRHRLTRQSQLEYIAGLGDE